MTTRLIPFVQPPDLSFGVPERPSIQELATIAAQIAQPDEDPKDAASRAMELFDACRDRLIKSHKDSLAASCKRRIKEIRQGMEENLGTRADGSPDTLDFDALLELFGAGTKEKGRERVAKSFLRYYISMREIMDHVPESRRLQGKEIEAATREMWTFYKSKGVSIDEALGLKDLFSIWHKEVHRAGIVADRATKSERAKLLLSICRKVLERHSLTKDEAEVLKAMDAQDLARCVSTLRKKNQLGVNGVGTLKAAIESANAPTSARPRRVKKSGS